MLADIQVTSQLYWIAALTAAWLDVWLIGWLIRRIDKNEFRQLGPWLVMVAMVFWNVLYRWAVITFWESCYQYLFPDWVPQIAFPFGLLIGLLGYLFWWSSLRLPGNPLWWFITLGAMHSLLGHFPAIFNWKILEKCPLIV